MRFLLIIFYFTMNSSPSNCAAKTDYYSIKEDIGKITFKEKLSDHQRKEILQTIEILNPNNAVINREKEGPNFYMPEVNNSARTFIKEEN